MAPRIKLPARLSSFVHNLNKRSALGWHFQLLVFFICAAAVIARRPDALFNPEFYAEDAVTWYSDAYNFGWLTALAWPAGGYLNTLQRLISSLTLLVPFHSVPLTLNLLGVTLQVLPVNVLLSGRCANWAALPVRLLFAVVYIALPNATEVHIVITNSQFHFALLAFLLATAIPPRTPAWKIVGLIVFAILGVSGPFSFVLLPLVLLMWWRQRDPWRLIVAGILAAFGAIQALVLFHLASAQRPPVQLGASFPLFVRLLGGRVYIAALIGGGVGVRAALPWVAAVTVLSTALVVYCLFKAPLPLRLFTVFAAVLLAASLARPLMGGPMPAWESLLQGGANRYWFFPMLAFLWCVIWCATSPTWPPARVFAICAMLAMLRGIEWDWHLRPQMSYQFQKYAAKFEAAKQGDLLTFPIFPPGWQLHITRNSNACPYMPVGRIETPAPKQNESAAFPVAGWVSAAKPIQSLAVYLDGALTKTTGPPTPAHPGEAAWPRHERWGAIIDASKLSVGNHEIVVRAVEQNGCSGEIDRVSFKR